MKWLRTILIASILSVQSVGTVHAVASPSPSPSPTPQGIGLSNSDKNAINNDTIYYDPDVTSTSCSVGDVPASTNLPAPVIKKINAHKDVYVQAAAKDNIPWQMLAAMHYRESSNGTTVSAATQHSGMYQITGKDYALTLGAVLTTDQFLQESQDAADFLVAKLKSNLSNHQAALGLTPDPEEVKDTFFSYNGRGSLYVQQAGALGFNSTTQPYEGSPYVMNFYDAKRQPGQPNWQQYGTGPGGGVGDATNQLGAYVVYARLGGAAGGGDSCTALGQTGNQIADIALGEVGTTGYAKYAPNYEQWCADFVSWVLKKAGKPFTPNDRIAGVFTVQAWFKANGIWVDNTPGGPPPQLGDVLIHIYHDPSTGAINGEHTNFVVGINGKQLTEVGGDQSNVQTGVSNIYTQTQVSKYTISNYYPGDSIVGWGRMK